MATTSANQTLVVGSTYTQEAKCEEPYSSNYYHTLKLSLTLNSINETTKTANITLKNILISRYISWTSDEVTFTLTQGNTTLKSAKASSGGSTSSSSYSKTYVTYTYDVPYNTDGTLTLSFSASVSGKGSTYAPGAATATINATFPVIDVASDFTLSNATALGSEITATITRQNTAFTHKVEYSFAGSTYTSVSTNATTSAKFTPALSLATNIPDATSGTLIVRVTTMNGTVQVGEPVLKTLTLSLPSSVVPTFTSVTAVHASDNTTVKEWGVYTKGYSKATLTINGAAGVHGSTIKSYSISGGGFSSLTSSFTTGILNTAGSITFTAVITDSRGRTATKTVTITVQDYNVPSISVTAFRCNSSGTALDSGTYLRVTATYAYSSVSSKNTITRSVTCNSVSNTSFTSGTAFTLNANVAAATSYTLTATISDALGNSSSATLNIPNTSNIPIHIKGNKKGLGLGVKATTDSTIEVGWPIDMNSKNINGVATITATGFAGNTTLTGTKTFTGLSKFQNGAAAGGIIIGADVTKTTLTNNTRKLGCITIPLYEDITKNCAVLSADMNPLTNYTDESGNCIEFGGRSGDTTNTAPDKLAFTVANSHNTITSGTKTTALKLTKEGAEFGVTPKHNGNVLATQTWVTSNFAKCPVGTVVVTSTNAAPSNTGTWTLIDKEFKTQTVTGTFTINTTNTTSCAVLAKLGGHTCVGRIAIVNKVALADSEIALGTFSWPSVGFNDGAIDRMLPHVNDGGNSIGITRLATGGSLTSLDGNPTGTSMAAGSTGYIHFTAVADDITTIIDSFCDKFYWQRTA